MKKQIVLGTNVLVGILVVFGFSGLGSANAATQTLVPLDSAGDQGNGQLCAPLSVSSDGRYVAFASSSSDLVSGDTNGQCDVFLRDTVAGTTTRESVSTTGVQANGQTDTFQMTRNARYILIASYADNLASGAQTTDAESLYLRDTLNNTTTLIGGSVGSGGRDISYAGWAISEDGRFVYYAESGTPASLNGMFVRDRLLGTTTRVDTAVDGTPQNDYIGERMSTDCAGRFVVFASVSSNLVAGDTPSTQDLFLVDTAGASRSITDITPAANHSPGSYQVTCDGNYVIYDSSASNLVSGDTDGHVDVFKYSIADGTTQLISTDASGNQYAAAACETSTPSCPYLGSVGNPSISMDGRYVAMNYVKEVTLGINNYFYGSLWIKDTVTGTLSEASQTTDGSSTDNSIYPTISADGREMYYLHQTDTGQPNRLYVATDYL